MGTELDRRHFLAGGALLLTSGCVTLRPDGDLVNTLDREVIALKQENARLSEALRTCDVDEEAPAIFRELRQVFSSLGVDVTRNGGDTHVILPGPTMFAPGSVRLRSESEMVMDLLSTALNLHLQTHVIVIGHTDDDPVGGRLKRQFPTNWELSAARAAAVVRSFVEDWGVSPHRFTAGGRGPWHPIADNTTAEGRELNRRVEVIIRNEAL
ncbi:MAG: OmpA family protein [Proteobacteria bacterium]|nr:OmpA family protein [Pseudomonadota bacterium]MCP4918560.1 OmpA family protein [Pseudomonadota bacterium]